MKKLWLVLALLILGSFASQGAFAVCNTDTDKFDTKGWCIDNNGVLTPKALETNGTATGYYGGSQSTIIVTTAAGPGPISLTAAESGSTIIDMGGVTSDTLAGSGNKYILPRAALGLKYIFTVGAKETITVDTLDLSDTFLYSPGGTGLQMGDSIKNPGQAGDTVTVTSGQANRWSITSQAGSSSVGGTTIDTLWLNNGTN